MKFDSPLFDSVRVKPDKDRRKRNDGPNCDWAGCKEKATNRAPKSRDRENEYWRFCLAHTRHYNQNYNFFAGMKDDDVLAFQKDALTGHRPTWKMGTGKRGAEKPDFKNGGDPFGLFHGVGGPSARPDAAPKPEARAIRNAERKAMETLGLEPGVTAVEIKTRFKALVKRHHPDANGGDRSSENRLVEVIQAYNYLKSVGLG